MTPQEFEKSVSKGNIPPVCYLYGEESFLLERAARSLLDKAIDASLKDFNLNVFYGGESKGVDIVDAAQTLPMFADRRAVLVKRSDQLKAESMEMLLPYIKDPAPATCLLMTGTKIDQRKKFFLELKKYGVIVEYKRLYEDKLPGFIQSEVAAQGKSIESAAAGLLTMLVGNNLQDLFSQLEKLVVYTGGRTRITVEDVRTITSNSKEFNAFELAKYLGLLDLPNAIRSMDAIFLNDREASLVITGALAQHFRQLWRVRELLDSKTPQTDIAREAKINPYFLKGYLQEAKNFTRAELENIFAELHRCDRASKTGGDPYGLIHGLVMGICRKELTKEM